MDLQTLTIQVKGRKALKLIKSLEALNLLKILSPSFTKPSKSKLSKRLSGSISKENADKIDEEIDQMRDEWERSI